MSEGITESICTLLGHPRECIHGSNIPIGPCCERAERDEEQRTVPLTQIPLGGWRPT